MFYFPFKKKYSICTTKLKGIEWGLMKKLAKGMLIGPFSYQNVFWNQKFVKKVDISTLKANNPMKTY